MLSRLMRHYFLGWWTCLLVSKGTLLNSLNQRKINISLVSVDYSILKKNSIWLIFIYLNTFRFNSFEWKSSFFSFKYTFHFNSFNFSYIKRMFVYIYIQVYLHILWGINTISLPHSHMHKRIIKHTKRCSFMVRKQLLYFIHESWTILNYLSIKNIKVLVNIIFVKKKGFVFK